MKKTLGLMMMLGLVVAGPVGAAPNNNPVVPVSVNWTGNGATGGLCNTLIEDASITAGTQVWQFNLSQAQDHGSILNAVFDSGSTGPTASTQTGNEYKYFVSTPLGAKLLSASATDGRDTSPKSVLTVSHCSIPVVIDENPETCTGDCGGNTVLPKAITVTADPKSKVYGSSDPALTYVFSPVLDGVDAFAGALSRDAGENVGTYSILQGNLSLSTNYALTYFGADFTITKATSEVTVNCPASVTYTGSAIEPCTASYTTEDGLTGSLAPSYSANVNVSDGPVTVSATYDGDDNHEGNSNTATFVINKADPIVVVAPYSVIYDGGTHTATGSAVGVLSESLVGLDLSNSTHINAGTYSDAWTFTDVTGNYNDASGIVSDLILKANATIVVNGYSLTFDNHAHTASGSATGVVGEPLSGLNLSGTTHTLVNVYNDTWTFTIIQMDL